jgi:hypothetical protein
MRSGYKIPRSDPAYVPTEEHPEVFNKVLGELFVERFGIRGQMTGGTQLQLDGL